MEDRLDLNRDILSLIVSEYVAVFQLSFECVFLKGRHNSGPVEMTRSLCSTSEKSSDKNISRWSKVGQERKIIL